MIGKTLSQFTLKPDCSFSIPLPKASDTTGVLVYPFSINAFFISENTVRTHIYNIFKKIAVSNRTQAACWANTHLRTPMLDELP